MDAPTPCRWTAPAHAAAVAGLRRAVERYAEARGAGGELLAAIGVAASEALTNAVLHGFCDRPAGTLTAEAAMDGGTLVVTVEDDGRGPRPRDHSPGLGKGVEVMEALAHDVRIRPRPGGGTCVELRFALRAGRPGPAAPA